MEFPTTYTTFTIPSGATTGARIVINENGSGTIRVYDSANQLVVDIGGPSGAIVSQSVSGIVDIVGGAIYLSPTAPLDQATASFINGFQADCLYVRSPNTVGTPLSSMFQLCAGVSGVPTGNVGSPYLALRNANTGDNTPADLYLTGNVIKTNANWNTLVAAANWSVIDLQVRRDAQDQLVYSGRIDYTGANVAGAGASVATLATTTPFQPQKQQLLLGVHRTSTGVNKNVSGSATVNTDGSISIGWGEGIAGTTYDVNGLATGDRFYFNASCPLGNLA